MFRRLTTSQLGQHRRHVDIGRCCFEPEQSTDMHHNRNYCIITPPIHCIRVSSQHFSNSTKYHRLAAVKQEQNRNLSFTSPDSTLLELTGQFSDHRELGAVVTQLASWVQLSWVRWCDKSKTSAQLNSTGQKFASFLSVVKFWTCSELHDWQKTGDFCGV